MKNIRISDKELLKKLLEEAAHLLPCQAPLQSFVHHNTLHNFENLPFKDALKKASLIFGAKSFMSEEFFQKSLDNGRIKKSDIAKIISQECCKSKEIIFKNGPTYFSYRSWRLLNLFIVPSVDSIDWWLNENSIFEAPHKAYGDAKEGDLSQSKIGKESLRALWDVLGIDEFEEVCNSPLLCHSREGGNPEGCELDSRLRGNDKEAADDKGGRDNRYINPTRFRDKILLHCNLDIDELTKPVLIKLASAFLDQGVAFDNMPQRNFGFLTTFRKIYSNTQLISESWMEGLADECIDQEKYDDEAVQVIIRILHIFGISRSDWGNFILQTLLSLRGWAGMFYQYENHPERIPVNYIPAKIIDFLAVQLTLELVATKHILRKIGSDFEEISRLVFEDKNRQQKAKILQYESFIMAQAFGLSAQDFADKNDLQKWQKEVADFNDFERRYYLHLAYELSYRQMILDSLDSHQKTSLHQKKKSYKFQAVFCMDEREECFRRHLEEISPEVETFGFAGFFGVAMQYRGIDDIRPKALCPVVITPDILVEEVAIDDSQFSRYAKNKRTFGKFVNFTRRMKKSLFLGIFWSFFVGIFKIIPLAGRSLFPLFTAKISHRIHKIGITKPKTKLILERVDEDAIKLGYKIGFSVDEMANIVFSVLNAMNLKKDFAPLVIMVGHGSSSLNNPHESAYNCGATGGGKGSANARAFSIMANHPEVRKKLQERGFAIPDKTMFVGAYHDTCNDSMEYYDLDLLSKEFRKKLSYAKNRLAKACRKSAQERCRRFDSVPLFISPRKAKTYVEQRSIDLAQPRPEYGHGTNAVCIIGRREKTAGLFMDRRSFLISYDAENDAKGDVLADVLKAAIPVGAGISLEYYFSSVDPFNYGCNTKLPHNITGLIGVMEGASSDLRTGLPWQTVEIHEPMRLLTIIEADAKTLSKIVQDNHEIGMLVKNDWVQLVSWNPEDGSLSLYRDGKFAPHKVEVSGLEVFKDSWEYYKGEFGHLDCVGVPPSSLQS